MALQNSSDIIPQYFNLATTAATIRTASVANAVKVTATRHNQMISLQVTPTMSSGANLAVSEFTLTPALPPSLRPPVAIYTSTNVVDDGSATNTIGAMVIGTDGVITFFNFSTWAAASYVPILYNVSVFYSAI